VKRGGSNSKEEEKPKEVVHVRARRGHATDSHSLAERVCSWPHKRSVNCFIIVMQLFACNVSVKFGIFFVYQIIFFFLCHLFGCNL